MLFQLNILLLLAATSLSLALSGVQKIYIPSENNGLFYGESLSGVHAFPTEEYAFVNQREHESGLGYYSDVVDSEGNVLTTIFDKYAEPLSIDEMA